MTNQLASPFGFTRREFFDAEPAADILSDDTIAEMLQKEQGIEVARRTVANYREAMNIPSSHDRVRLG